MSALGSAWPGGALMTFALALLPAAALVARPMSALRRSMALVDDFEGSLDPRRGLEAVCADLVEHVRSRTQAGVVALVLPSEAGAPAMLASRGEGCFRVKAEVHSGIETLLTHVPACPVSHAERHRWDPRQVTWAWTADLLPQKLTVDLKELARTLDVRRLHIFPLTRYGRPHGHVVVGYHSQGLSQFDLTALADAAPEMLRVVEQAALVDLLQEESAGHERARIGRDLHDSAIQPYLALKYAVESVALRVPPDNPARAEIDMLTELVNGEVAALRELISALRTGSMHGESTLVPAVRRQVKRFSTLFGIQVELDCPSNLPTTRAVANSLLHMVNEVLNNIRRHTMARHVWVKLSAESQNIRLVVRDDGGTVRGLPAEEFNPSSLTQRAAELGGFLTISRPDDLNTELVIQIPF
jgi:signal transduction histidine kinase